MANTPTPSPVPAYVPKHPPKYSIGDVLNLMGTGWAPVLGTRLNMFATEYEYELFTGWVPESWITANVLTSTTQTPVPLTYGSTKPKFIVGDKVFYAWDDYVVVGVITSPTNQFTYDIETMVWGIAARHVGIPEADLSFVNYSKQSSNGTTAPVEAEKPNICNIVKSSCAGKEFLYCRTHDHESQSAERCGK